MLNKTVLNVLGKMDGKAGLHGVHPALHPKYAEYGLHESLRGLSKVTAPPKTDAP